MTDMHAVYDGQLHVGTISQTTNGFSAFDLTGKELGIFQTRTEAVRCVLAPLAPPAETSADTAEFDADRALINAIEELTKGGGR